MSEKFAKKRKKGEIIFCEFEPGSTVFFLQSGTVKITKIVSDKEKTLALLKPGDIFGEMALLEKAPRSATAIAEGDVELLEFSNKNFAQLVNAQHSIAVKLLKALAERIKDQSRKYRIINLPDNESKVMDVFLMLTEDKGNKLEKNEDVDAHFEIDAANIANWAGISENDCDVVLADMETQNKISRKEKKITVKNLYQFFRHISSKRSAMERDGEN